MDPAKIIEAVQAAGPGAGVGLALGLLLLVGGLTTEKWVMGGRFKDMKEQRDKAEKRTDALERDLRATTVERDELRIMVTGALAVSRRNAQLATSVMHRRVEREQEGVGR